MDQRELTQIKSESLLELPTNKLLDDFGAGRASPGSGSAAALLAILSCKMIITVSDISLNKQECNKSHKEISYIKERVVSVIEPRLKVLFEADARDFDEVVKLRVLRDQAQSSADKSNYSRKSLDMLEVATDYTFEIADKALTLVEYGISIFENGWHAIRGDSGVSVSAAMSAVMSCIFIINLNLKTLKRRNYSSRHLDKVKDLQKSLELMQLRALSCVTSIGSESVEAVQFELKNT
ncbi:cyclodeaminase/cyclohydrolase family protein [Ferrimonas kyonanensis]|uniref:cyclodeaminase/cyclohydrolase family protein n=1 Tax=Ferrimonas kyonanensis TaxID=364763 RepID=UPI0009FBD7ED|nr:cyclodeaminase/cyclohydrolase family protein [Ferrimonas kyonanensis]